jgi:hypothetical protein
MYAGNPIIEDILPEAEGLKHPNGDDDHNHYIQNGFDASSHRDVRIDQPQNDSDYHECQNNGYKWHNYLSAVRKQVSCHLKPGNRLAGQCI